MAQKMFPRYLPHAFGRNGEWAVSLFDGRGVWQNTGQAVGNQTRATRIARNANRQLRKKEKKKLTKRPTSDPGEIEVRPANFKEELPGVRCRR